MPNVVELLRASIIPVFRCSNICQALDHEARRNPPMDSFDRAFPGINRRARFACRLGFQPDLTDWKSILQWYRCPAVMAFSLIIFIAAAPQTRAADKVE